MRFGSIIAAAVVGAVALPGTVSRLSGQEEAGITSIVSDYLEMKSTPEKNYFYFENHVRVAADNLIVRSDRLEVVAARDAAIDDADATIGEIGSIEIITATGNVQIYQAGREAYAGKAVVLPREEKVVLTESPRVVDGSTEVSGWRITLVKGERKARVESNPELSERPTIILGSLPDLGFEDKGDKESGKEEEESSAPAKEESNGP